MRFAAALAALVLVAATSAEARTYRVRPGPDAQLELQAALSAAQPGDTVRLARGRYDLTLGLTLSADDVTVRGEGQDRTILSFTGQTVGDESLLVTANRVVLRDFAVEDALRTAIKVRDCAGVEYRDVRAEWTRGPHPENGAFGIVAASCSNVLIDSVIARGAADAGILVDNSRNIIVRDSIAELNVAGIVIENSLAADVTKNTVMRNSAGVLVVGMPGGGQGDAGAARVFRNDITNNDTPNFARADTPAAAIPPGVGVLVMAAHDVHVFENAIADNATTSVLIGAYRGSISDARFNPLPRNVMVRDNRFGNAGYAPGGDLVALSAAGVVMPDVLWDGADTYFAGGMPRSEPVRIVIDDNRSTRTAHASFLSLGVPVAGSDFTEALPDPTPPPVIALPEPEPVRLP